jgi:uncharacterized protein
MRMAYRHGKRVGGMLAVPIRLRQQGADHHLHLPLVAMAGARYRLLDRVGRVFGNGNAGPCRHQQGNAARLAKFQRGRRVAIDEGCLDRRLVGPVHLQHELQPVMQLQQPVGQHGGIVGGHRTCPSETEAIGAAQNDTPAGPAKSGIDAENANRILAVHCEYRTGMARWPAIGQRQVNILDLLKTLLADSAFLWLMAIVLVAGIVRGFAGFGTGLIVSPACAALFSPQAALITLFVLDLGPSNLLVLQAWKHARWREVIPMSIGNALLFPAGLLFLKFGDPLVLRWAITIVVLAFVALLAAGFRYHGERKLPVSVGVGAMAGFLSGFAGIPGPPVILYWMAAAATHSVVRANLIMFFAVGEVISGIGLWAGGIFELRYVVMGAIACLPYLAGLLLGSALFRLASEHAYRRVAILLVTAAAILSAPALDGIMR